jgi:hypothetical protein
MSFVIGVHRNRKTDTSTKKLANQMLDILGVVGFRFDDLPLLFERCNLSLNKFCKMTSRHKNTVKGWLNGDIPEEIKEDILTVLYYKENGLCLLGAGKHFIDKATGKKLHFDTVEGRFIGHSKGMTRVLEKYLRPNINPTFECDILAKI